MFGAALVLLALGTAATLIAGCSGGNGHSTTTVTIVGSSAGNQAVTIPLTVTIRQ
jgi:hypothetical protein